MVAAGGAQPHSIAYEGVFFLISQKLLLDHGNCTKSVFWIFRIGSPQNGNLHVVFFRHYIAFGGVFPIITETTFG